MSAPTDLDRTAREAASAWEAMERGTGSRERYLEALAVYRNAQRRSSALRHLKLTLFWFLAALAMAIIAIGVSVLT